VGQELRLAHQDPRQSLEIFRVLREANLRLLKTIPQKRWNYYGMHEERGKETVARLVRMLAGHDRNHMAQIVTIAQGLSH
jgi:hypothetical protein